MSHVNINIDGSGGECAAACSSVLTHQVSAELVGQSGNQIFGPCTLESALQILNTLSGRSDCINATIQAAS